MNHRLFTSATINLLRLFWIAPFLLSPSSGRTSAGFRSYATCRDPGAPRNGYRYGGDGGFLVGSGVVFRCRLGYRLRGEPRLSCVDGWGEGGDPVAHWSGEAPQCVLSALPLRMRKDERNRHLRVRRTGGTACTDYGAPDNGFRTLQSWTSDGSTVTFGCNQGFDLEGVKQLTCRQGEWNGDWPLCRPAMEKAICGDPGIPLMFGRRLIAGTLEGSTVTYSCPSGFALKGDTVRICLASGEWSGDLPMCKIVTCGQPPAPPRGAVFFNSLGYGFTATYACLRGHILEGASEVTCLENGTWSSEPPNCRAIHCRNLPSPMHGMVTYRQPAMYMDVATYLCNTGHGVVGRDTRVCLANGTWSGEAPICLRGRCDELQNPENGLVHYSSADLNTIATYSCSYGYHMIGMLMRMCQRTGRWSGSAPSCNSSRCSNITIPRNGRVSQTDESFVFSIATHRCVAGYSLYGNETRECQPSGIWSGRPPACFPIQCPFLEAPSNGFLTLSNRRCFKSEVTYGCNAGYELYGGDMIRTCQQNRLWSGQQPSCIRIIADPVVCEQLSNPAGGLVSTASTRVGSVATYTCLRGSLLSGDHIRICLGTGMWSGDPPTCEPVNCSSLDAPDNGDVMVGMTTFESVATYSCDPSFRLIGVTTRTCQLNGSWSGEIPVCEAVVCGDLMEPANGAVNLSEGSLVGADATYTCDPSFRLIGTTSRTCQQNGSWSGEAPVCEAVDCGDLMEPANGAVNLSEGSLVGADATYTCDPLFRLIGTTSRTCQQNGSWSGEAPVCEAVDCGDLMEPANGAVNLSEGSLVGADATYTCDPSFRLIGTTSRTCQQNGSWSGEAPVCEAVDCGDLMEPANGAVNLSEGSLVGADATYTCDPSFRLIGTTSRTCQQNGSWSGEAPVCEAVDCGDLMEPANGAVNLSEGSLVGADATYTCDSSFRLIGTTSRTCQQNGSWSGEAPVCEAVDCGDLMEPANGAVNLSEGSLVGADATYTCDSSFRLIGTTSRTCQQNGSWSGEAPVCEVIVCPSLDVPPFGAITYTPEAGSIAADSIAAGSIAAGSIATYSCVQRYTLIGGPQRTCLETGLWSGQAPTCELIECQILKDPINGMVRTLDTIPGSLAFYMCNVGFNLLGNSTRLCERVGEKGAEWSGEDPVCERVMCPALDDPENGKVTTTNTEAVYRCNAGFVSRGGQIRRICMADGTWSGVAPMCVLPQMQCPNLEAPQFGSIEITGDRTLGSMAMYECDLGYEIDGMAERVCELDGRVAGWSGEAPTCQVVLCPVLEPPVDGTVAIFSLMFGGTALYRCNVGFIENGPISRECQSSGWSGNETFCDPRPGTVSCGRLEDPNNGMVVFSSTQPGSVASYSCRRGYTLEGVEERQCQGNGTWDSTEPSCVVANCGPLSDPTNGIVFLPSNTTLGTSARYECNSGYMLVGLTSEFRFCTDTGTWSEVDPTCDPVDCGSLSPPVNGIVNQQQGTMFTAVAFYSCLEGYVLTPAEAVSRTCTDMGVWSNSEPTCELMESTVDCGALLPPLNGEILLLNSSTGQEALAEYTCRPGYMIVGVAIRQCQITGQWDGEAPECVVRQCPSLEAPENGQLFVLGTEVNSSVTYRCRPGFELVGLVRRLCQENGEWSGDDTLCLLRENVRCPSLAPPTNGSVAVADQSVGSEALYSCNEGFVLDGPSSRSCRTNGAWTETEPICERIQCPDPGSPGDGRRLGEMFQVGNSVLFLCSDGFELDGASILTCQEDGTWDQATPTCTLPSMSGSRRSRRGSCSGTEEVLDGLGRWCRCTAGHLESCCRYRQEWSQLTMQEKLRYIAAVKTAATDPQYRPIYAHIMRLYWGAFSGVVLNTTWETSQFFPWHRYYLQLYEDLLRVVDSSVTIPYWDWTTHPEKPYDSPVFDPNLGFGNSVDNVTYCVNSGPFQQGEFSITPLAGGGCIRRTYGEFPFFNRQLLNSILSITATSFGEFHSSLQLFFHLTIRCFIGGTMCTNFASEDPLYLLLLAQLDRLLDKWQSLDDERALARYADDTSPLVHTLGDTKLTVSDYSSNKELPYGISICYSEEPPDAVEPEQQF